MLIPYEEVAASVATENPWWGTKRIPKRFDGMERRAYFDPFYQLATKWDINRAVILLGPRRVGKTVMTHHLVARLISDGINAKHIMYVSIDTPTYTGQSLQFFVDMHVQSSKTKKNQRMVIIFDEVQYLADWGRHLKVLVDRYPNIKFIASGSAAAALRLASAESGAGRFTDFMLPQLYGITNIQELNNLFTSLAYRTGQEISLEALASNSGISKPTITRYIEYLEAAFLIFRVKRVDQSAKTFERERTFKVFLTNPSMRAALFSPVADDNDLFGNLVETAIYSQWFHSSGRNRLHYARWKRSGKAKIKSGDHGEIDLVYLDPSLLPAWIIEIKWSDSAYKSENCWASIREFVSAKDTIDSGIFTSKSVYDTKVIGDVTFKIIPAATYCFSVGHNTVRYKKLGTMQNLDE